MGLLTEHGGSGVPLPYLLARIAGRGISELEGVRQQNNSEPGGNRGERHTEDGRRTPCERAAQRQDRLDHDA